MLFGRRKPKVEVLKVKINVEHNHASVIIGGESYTVITPGSSPMGSADVHLVGFVYDIEQVRALETLGELGLKPCTFSQLLCLGKQSSFDIYCLGSTLYHADGRSPGQGFVAYLERKTGLSPRRSDFRTLFRWARVAAVEG